MNPAAPHADPMPFSDGQILAGGGLDKRRGRLRESGGGREREGKDGYQPCWGSRPAAAGCIGLAGLAVRIRARSKTARCRQFPDGSGQPFVVLCTRPQTTKDARAAKTASLLSYPACCSCPHAFCSLSFSQSLRHDVVVLVLILP